MRRRLLFGLTVFLALGITVFIPWFSLREARHQAYDAAAELTLGYARDILHRTEDMATQSQAAVERLKQADYAPCSPAALLLMRQLDLTLSHIQAIGYVRDGVMVCSSLGGPPLELGGDKFQTLNHTEVYLNVPVNGAGRSPVLALARDHYAVLIHRGLLLDTGNAVAGVSLGVFQLDRAMSSMPDVARGHVQRDWLLNMGLQQETTFIDGGYLVGMVRSRPFRIVAVAAVPVAYLRGRATPIALRLVPAGFVAGLAIAGAVLLLARRQRSLSAALRYALRSHEFFMVYQPIVDLHTRQLIGVEALLRWRRATGELIGPDLFIPVAEQSGIIIQLTARVLQLIAVDIGDFLVQHPAFHIGINLSPADLASNVIVDRLDDFFKQSGARPSNVIVEITERGFLDIASASRVIAAIRQRGIAVAIDDFGTGYSSLSYLESLDLDFLKIDRAFVEAIGTKASTSQVVVHIIAMARALGLLLIAEGVEHAQQAEFLRTQNVQYAQGWLFGKPMSFEEVIQTFESVKE